MRIEGRQRDPAPPYEMMIPTKSKKVFRFMPTELFSYEFEVYKTCVHRPCFLLARLFSKTPTQKGPKHC